MEMQFGNDALTNSLMQQCLGSKKHFGNHDLANTCMQKFYLASRKTEGEPLDPKMKDLVEKGDPSVRSRFHNTL